MSMGKWVAIEWIKQNVLEITGDEKIADGCQELVNLNTYDLGKIARQAQAQYQEKRGLGK
jgi:hypothetical protein